MTSYVKKTPVLIMSTKTLITPVKNVFTKTPYFPVPQRLRPALCPAALAPAH
jgi:hypothetical protein